MGEKKGQKSKRQENGTDEKKENLPEERPVTDSQSVCLTRKPSIDIVTEGSQSDSAESSKNRRK